MRADLREPPLGGIGEAVEHRPRDRQLEDAVPEELEALVRLRAVLGPRRMGEDLRQAVGGELRYETAELLRPGGLRRLRPNAR